MTKQVFTSEPITNKDNAVGPGANHFLCLAAVNSGFGVYLQRLVVCELALIIDVAPIRWTCTLCATRPNRLDCCVLYWKETEK